MTPEPKPIRALLVPANPYKRISVVPISDNPYESAGQYLGGFPERAAYDFDSSMYVNSQGLYSGLPLNERATHYVRTQSDAARQRRSQGASLYGDVLIVGEEDLGGGELRTVDVPDRLVELFTGQDRGVEQ